MVIDRESIVVGGVLAEVDVDALVPGALVPGALVTSGLCEVLGPETSSTCSMGGEGLPRVEVTV